MKIVEGVYGVDASAGKAYPLNTWILDCKEGVTLVDGGEASGDVDKIAAELKSIGKSWKDVKQILVTHRHPDHTSNLKKLNELTSAPVKAHVEDAEAIEKVAGIRIVGLRDGEVMTQCGGIEVVWVPGHTEGNVSYYLPEKKLIIAGDTVFPSDGGSLTPPPEMYNKDTGQATKSIMLLLDYDFDTVLVTHGPGVLKGARKKVEILVDKTSK